VGEFPPSAARQRADDEDVDGRGAWTAPARPPIPTAAAGGPPARPPRRQPRPFPPAPCRFGMPSRVLV